MNIKNIVTFGYAEKEEAAKKEFEHLHLKWQEWETEAKAYDQSKEKLNETIEKIVSVCKENDLFEKSDIVSELYSKLLQNNVLPPKKKKKKARGFELISTCAGDL